MKRGARDKLRFGQLFYKFRTRNRFGKVSQERLAAAIGTSRQYIDAIEKEKQGVSAPKLEHCIALAEELALSEEEKQAFFLLAFQERIKNNLGFYEFIHKKGMGKVKAQDNESVAEHIDPKQNITYLCNYYIQLQVKEEKKDIIPIAKEFLVVGITKETKEMGYQLINLEFIENKIEITVSCDPNCKIHDFIEHIKTTCKRTIKNNCPRIKLPVSSIWEKGYKVYSLGTFEEANYKKMKIHKETLRKNSHAL